MVPFKRGAFAIALNYLNTFSGLNGKTGSIDYYGINFLFTHGKKR